MEDEEQMEEGASSGMARVREQTTPERDATTARQRSLSSIGEAKNGDEEGRACTDGTGNGDELRGGGGKHGREDREKLQSKVRAVTSMARTRPS